MGKKTRRIRNKKTGNRAASATAPATATAAEVTTAAAVATSDAAEEYGMEKWEARDNQLPKSDVYVQAMAGKLTIGEKFRLINRGITGDDCVHCMFYMGVLLGGNPFVTSHAALPWYLEGAIRGSIQSTRSLMGRFYIQNAAALHGYWGEIFRKHFSEHGNALGEHKDLKDLVERECAICSKTDTKTLTLQQCKGCSAYCYCGEGCQAIHWEEHKHRNECKQVQTLNKYHKPYAKEIRDAVIRGDKEIPTLEKLRYKLGLTRPQEEYIEFFELTHSGKKIDPDDYLVGREDGTLWVGSVPISPIRRNDTIIVLPTLRHVSGK